MVYNGKPYENGWFGGTTIFGNTHVVNRDEIAVHLNRSQWHIPTDPPIQETPNAGLFFRPFFFHALVGPLHYLRSSGWNGQDYLGVGSAAWVPESGACLIQELLPSWGVNKAGTEHFFVADVCWSGQVGTWGLWESDLTSSLRFQICLRQSEWPKLSKLHFWHLARRITLQKWLRWRAISSLLGKEWWIE